MLRPGFLVLFFTFCACACAPRPPATPPTAPAGSWKPIAGPHTVTVVEREWTDAKRGNRKVPTRIYLPDGEGPFPVIVFSHGAGANRETYEYAGRHWASHGYVSVHPQHHGSDTAALLRHGLMKIVDDKDNWRNRPEDVSFVIDQLAADPLAKQFDLENLGAGGHSFGAYTTMAVAGAKIDLKGELDHSFLDSRVDAAVAMSPQGKGTLGLDKESWKDVSLPILYFTGTEDSGLQGADWHFRRDPFDWGTGKDQSLVVITGAAHRAFADVRGRRDPRHHGWILQESTAFWDAYLKKDAGAKAWLDAQSLEKISGGEVAVERR